MKKPGGPAGAKTTRKKVLRGSNKAGVACVSMNR